MKLESGGEDPIAVVFGREDCGSMTPRAAAQAERDDRMEIAEGPERGEDDAHRQSTV